MTEEVFSGPVKKITARNIAACRDRLNALLADAVQLDKFLAGDGREAIFDGDTVFYKLASREQIGEFVKILDERIAVLGAPHHAFLAG